MFLQTPSKDIQVNRMPERVLALFPTKNETSMLQTEERPIIWFLHIHAQNSRKLIIPLKLRGYMNSFFSKTSTTFSPGIYA